MVKRKYSNEDSQIIVLNKKSKIDFNKTDDDHDFVLTRSVVENAVLLDKVKKPWRIGDPIGKGGFGEIFLASDNVSRPVTMGNAEYVVKFEPHLSGPLFVEIHCLLNAGKPAGGESLPNGMPEYIASGTHYFANQRYRFLILHRYECDLHSIIKDRRVHPKHVLIIACQIIDILEYFHDKGYVHSDIKPENLMIDRCASKNRNRVNIIEGAAQNGFTEFDLEMVTNPAEVRIFLIDFGLASKYIDRSGKHRPFCKNKCRAHDGTLEFTSRDAHMGVHSRRSDLECLGYNLIYWYQGTLPWIDDHLLKQPKRVHEMKEYFMTGIELVLRELYGPNVPQFLVEFMLYVGSLEYEERPDYGLCKYIFQKAFTSYCYNLKADMVLNIIDLKQSVTKMSPEELPNMKHVTSIMKLSMMLPLRGSNELYKMNHEPYKARRHCENVLKREVAQQMAVSDKYTGHPTYAISQMEQKIRFKDRLDQMLENQFVDNNIDLITKGYTKSMIQIVRERQNNVRKLDTVQERTIIELGDSSSSDDGEIITILPSKWSRQIASRKCITPIRKRLRYNKLKRYRKR